MADHEMEPIGEPILTPVKNGWAAHGDGWAVHGKTRDEAVLRFRDAERRNREIDARPYWYERSRVVADDSHKPARP